MKTIFLICPGCKKEKTVLLEWTENGRKELPIDCFDCWLTNKRKENK